MVEGSPKLLSDFAYDKLQSKLVQAEVCALNTGKDHVPAEALRSRGWWTEEAAKLYKSKTLSIKERAALRQVMSNCCTTAGTLHRRGLVDRPLCLCGEVDTMAQGMEVQEA